MDINFRYRAYFCDGSYSYFYNMADLRRCFKRIYCLRNVLYFEKFYTGPAGWTLTNIRF